MFCPNDQCPDFLDTGLVAEYRPEIMVCPFCGTPLVADRPETGRAGDDGRPDTPRVADDEEMEPVIEASDLTEVTVIKSLLDGAGIPYLALGEERFDAFRRLFAGGSIFNPRSRAVIFVVPARMVEEARQLLAEFDEDLPELEDER